MPNFLRKIEVGVPISLGKMEWGCRFSGGANFPVTPAAHNSFISTVHVHVCPLPVQCTCMSLRNARHALPVHVIDNSVIMVNKCAQYIR